MNQQGDFIIMKLVKTASGKTTIKMSKKEWKSIGKKAGWLNKEAIGGGGSGAASFWGKNYTKYERQKPNFETFSKVISDYIEVERKFKSFLNSRGQEGMGSMPDPGLSNRMKELLKEICIMITNWHTYQNVNLIADGGYSFKDDTMNLVTKLEEYEKGQTSTWIKEDEDVSDSEELSYDIVEWNYKYIIQFINLIKLYNASR